jgi:chemotaxis protein MotA
LLCYGFLGPLASNLQKISDAEGDYLRCLRQGVIAFVKGSAPILAVEFARRSIPGDIRPSFQELEAGCRSGAANGGGAAGAEGAKS